MQNGVRHALRRGLLALALVGILTVTAPATLAHPSDCDAYVFDLVRWCRGLPGGARGVYVDSPVFFVMLGSGDDGLHAGGGSAAGATAHASGERVALVAYANGIAAFGKAIVRAEPGGESAVDGAPGGVLVTVPVYVRSAGLVSDHDTSSQAFVGDRTGDGTPDDPGLVVLGQGVPLLP